MKIAGLCALTVLYCLPVFGQTARSARSFWSGHTLQEKCNKFTLAERNPNSSAEPANILDIGQCRGYVAAIADQLEANNLIRTPLGVSDIDAVRIINLYIEHHPEQLYLSAQTVVGLAIHEKFPVSPERN